MDQKTLRVWKRTLNIEKRVLASGGHLVNQQKNQQNRGIGFWSATAIGVGGMVGGGIFAVLGLAVQLAKGGTPVAFLLGGTIAMITSYSYARLSVTYPSRGGTVEFLNRAFGTGIITGGLNILLWISYIVMISLYAYAFGSYGASFLPQNLQPVWKHVFITGIVILLTGLNTLSASIVGKAEEWIVIFKVAILFLFIIAGIWTVDSSRIQLQTWAHPLQLVVGGMIIFLAYEGFELIANTTEEIKDQKERKRLPLAYYTSVGLVMFLYIMVALVTVGNLPYDQIIAAEDYALAASARPFLGNAGFTLIAIAALLSTTSAINASLYGAARVSYIIAKEGELPEVLEHRVWNRPTEGLLITTGLALLLANLFDLSSIAIMGSAGFLLIFSAVNMANARLYKKTKSNRLIPVAGAIVCLMALIILVSSTAGSLRDIGILAVMIGSSFAIEYAYRKLSKREIQPLPDIMELD